MVNCGTVSLRGALFGDSIQ